MMEKLQLEELLKIAVANGGDFADIFIEQKKTTGIGLEENKIERINTGIDVGAGIRVVSNNTTSFGFTNDISFEGIKKAVKIVSKAAEGAKNNINLDLTVPKPIVDFPIKQRPDEVNVDDKVATVQKANKTARGVDKRIKQVTVGFGDVIQKITIANTDGIYVEDERIRTRFMTNVVASDGDIIQTGYSALGGVKGFELFEEKSPEEVAEEAAKRAVLMLSAKPAPSGKMAVVMAGEAGGTMVHEACGHGLEADLVQKKLSVYAGKMGQKVASELVTVVDDGTLPGKYGSFRFDDEGTPSSKTVLIKEGILEEYMYDKLTSRKEQRYSTGNGRRESYQERPIPRMTNTYIASGKSDPEKIIKECKSGILVLKMGGGQVNTTNGDYVFDVAEGFLIKDGEITTPVRGATLTGNGPETLQRVDMVGSDLGFTIGTCGKEGQGVPVSDAQPTMLISELVVGGTGSSGEGPEIRRIRRM